jgi:hypothetical protein
VRREGPFKEDPLARQPIDVGRGESVVTVAAHVVGPKTVDSQEDEVEGFLAGHGFSYAVEKLTFGFIVKSVKMLRLLAEIVKKDYVRPHIKGETCQRFRQLFPQLFPLCSRLEANNPLIVVIRIVSAIVHLRFSAAPLRRLDLDHQDASRRQSDFVNGLPTVADGL